jgi:predicted phage terminase large subunit-like protein
MCKQSYYQFFLEFWRVMAAEKLQESWYIKKLCDDIQEISERVFADKPKLYDEIWNCPPGTSKSSCTSIGWQPWAWTRMPSARFITGSFAERLALDLSRKSRDIVTCERYQELFPEIKLRDDQNTKSYFANTAGGMRYAVGVGGSVIGMHAHFIIVDDPIDPQAALSDLILADANNWMTETLSQRKVNSLLTPMFLIMQRLHQDDPTGSMLSRGMDVRHRCLPADLAWDVKPEEWRAYYHDGLLDPNRLSRRALEEKLGVLQEVGYAGQFGQNPVPRGGAKFKVDNLKKGRVPPTKWKRGPVRYWDKAATRGGGAYTAGVKEALDMNDELWILDVERGQWDSGARERRMGQVAAADGKHTRIGVEQEPGAGGKESAEGSVRRLTLAGFRAYMDKVTGDKELRADPLSVYVNMGKVTLLEAPWNDAFVHEMRFFPRSKYKDQVDAAGGAFGGLTRRRYKIGAL